MSAAEFVEQLVELIAERVASRLATAQYSQDALPPSMTKRAYLDHCARGDWPNAKVGRLRVTKVADFQTWLDGRTVTTKRRKTRADVSIEEIVAGRLKRSA